MLPEIGLIGIHLSGVKILSGYFKKKHLILPIILIFSILLIFIGK